MRSQRAFVAFAVMGAALVSSPRRATENPEYVRRSAWTAATSTVSESSAETTALSPGRIEGRVPAASQWISGGSSRLSRNPLQTSAVTKRQVIQSYGRLPLSFEANRGQSDPQVKFLARGSGYGLFLTSTEAVLALRGAWKEKEIDAEASIRERRNSEFETRHAPGPFDVLFVTPSAIENPRSRIDSASAVLRLKLMGTDPSPQVAGIDELPGKNNYFIGNDPKKWRSDVPAYAEVKYRGVYPGIDLVYHGNQRQLEYDFVVAPGANPGRIRLSFQGAEGMEIDAQGNLVLHTAAGEVWEHKPTVYQETAGIREWIACSYVLRGRDEVGFAVARYDSSRPLVLDPVLSYSTFLGGSQSEYGADITVDSAGNAYVTGYTESTNFPTTPGAFQTTLRPAAAFVTKLNTNGSQLVYSTYLGGSGSDLGAGIAVDSAGNAYVTGASYGPNFPTTPGAFQTTFVGSGGFRANAFVTKLNPAGSQLVYSTYLGGTVSDLGAGIAVDASGNAYVTGSTSSTDFPITPGAFQPTFGGGPYPAENAFVTKLNPAGSQLVYSTYLGGSGGPGGDLGRGITVDSAGNAYVTGFTLSTNFPTTPGAFQTTLGGSGDAFVTKLNTSGSQLVYSTYLGSSSGGTGIAVDSAGNAYVTGAAGNVPTTTGAFQRTGPGAFVTKFNSDGSQLVYSTYLGDGGPDGIAVDSAGNAYVTGQTFSTNFPTSTGAFQKTLRGTSNVFVTKLNASGSQLVYSTYLGGQDLHGGTGIAVDSAGNAYVTGFTNSDRIPYFPTTMGAFQTTFGGVTDAFIAKVVAAPNFSLSLSPATHTIAAGQSTTYTLTVTPQEVELMGTVALSCAGAPDGATCSISPASVALQGDGPTAFQTATVTVTTTARSLLWPTLRFPAGPSGPRLGLLLGIVLAFLGTLAVFSKVRRRATPLLGSAIFLLLLCIACGGGGSSGGGTRAGTYTLTLTGTSGSVTHTSTVTLTVN